MSLLFTWGKSLPHSHEFFPSISFLKRGFLILGALRPLPSWWSPFERKLVHPRLAIFYFLSFKLRMSLIFITSSTMLYLGSWVNLLLVMVSIYSLNHVSVFFSIVLYAISGCFYSFGIVRLIQMHNFPLGVLFLSPV